MWGRLLRMAKEHGKEAHILDDGMKCTAPISLGRVKITDAFWKNKMELVRREMLPYQWKALNDQLEGAEPSFCMHNFRVAGKLNVQRKTQGKDFAERYRSCAVLPTGLGGEGGGSEGGTGEAGEEEMSEEEKEWRDRIATYETDPETGYLIEPETGVLIDPATGQAVESAPLMD